jgi:flagellar biosynthesis protein
MAGLSERSGRPPTIEPGQERAVALTRDGDAGDPPRIVASGRGDFAEQILQIAFENGVKVREDADLVEILSALDVDSMIPVEVLSAVAEILSYVYRANRELEGAGEQP